MENLRSPQAQVDEGAYAIKVSMRSAVSQSHGFILFVAYARTISRVILSQLSATV